MKPRSKHVECRGCGKRILSSDAIYVSGQKNLEGMDDTHGYDHDHPLCRKCTNVDSAALRVTLGIGVVIGLFVGLLIWAHFR